jgi:hypothetical protein
MRYKFDLLATTLVLSLIAVQAACTSSDKAITRDPVETSIDRASPSPLDISITPTTEATEELPKIVPTVEEFIPSSSLPSLPRIPIPPPIPQAPQQRTHYVIDVTLDYANHSLAVTENITYYNTTASELTAIPLVIEPRRYPGAFRLTSLLWEDGSRITQYQMKERQLTLMPPEPLPPGESLHFILSYELTLPYTPKLPNIRPYPFSYTDLQANLGDWYPYIPPYAEGIGWLIHNPGFYGEHLAYDIADFEVSIHNVGEQSDLIIAASAPAEVDGEWLRYDHKAARSFAWSASPYYQVVTQTVEIGASHATTVASYYLPFYAEAGESALRTLSQALPLYSRIFGAYSRPMLTAVQAEFLDGMEYEGLYFLSRDFYNYYNGSEASYLVALSAHETAHQWWYGLVGNDQALEPWLDEALCTYSESLFYEYTHPEALDWWWEYRVNYYQPKGQIDIRIYDAPEAVGQYRAYRDAVYLNGALFLGDLRSLIGDEAFFTSLQTYLNQNAYKQTNAESFFEIVSNNTKEDLNPLLNEYFSRIHTEP